MKSGGIKACPRCGSLRIRALSLREGGIPGTSEVAGIYYCEGCRGRIVPVLFGDEKQYRKFLEKRLRKAPHF